MNNRANVSSLNSQTRKNENSCGTGCRGYYEHVVRTCSQRTTTPDVFIDQAGCSIRYRLNSHDQITAIQTISPAALRTVLV